MLLTIEGSIDMDDDDLVILSVTRPTTHSSCHSLVPSLTRLVTHSSYHSPVLPLFGQSFFDEVHVCVDPLPELEVFLQLVLDELCFGDLAVVERHAVQLTPSLS